MNWIRIILKCELDPNYVKMRVGSMRVGPELHLNASWIRIIVECELDPNYIGMRVGSMRVGSA